MNLRRFECFLTVAELGTVTAAAEVLHMAQPALSRQIKLFEHELNLQLFTRAGNRLQLTRAGLEFKHHATELMSTASRVARAAEDLSRGNVKQLRCVAAPSTIAEWLSPFLATLPLDRPLVITTAASHFEIYAALTAGYDFIVTAEAPRTTYATRALGEVPILALCADDHPWALTGRTRVNIAELVSEQVITHDMSSVTRQILERALADSSLSYEPLAECHDAATLAAHASAGRGIAVLSELTHASPRAFELEEVNGEPLAVPIHMAWDPSHYAAAEIEGLASAFAEHFPVTLGTRRSRVSRRDGD